MGTKEVVLGLIIFIFVAILIFFVTTNFLKFSDTISALLALVIGAIAELFYRKKARSLN